MFRNFVKWPVVLIAFAAIALALAQPGWSQDQTFKVVMELTGIT